MATQNTDQLTSLIANSTLDPNENAGRERIFRFSFTTSAGTPLNNGDTLVSGVAGTNPIHVIPKGARVIGGNATYGTFGASTTLSIGTGATATQAANATAFLNAQSVASAGQSALANTQALNYGLIVTSATPIVLTAGGANFANGQTIAGHIAYVID